MDNERAPAGEYRFEIIVTEDGNMTMTTDGEETSGFYEATFMAAGLMAHYYAQRSRKGYEAALDMVRGFAMCIRKDHKD